MATINLGNLTFTHKGDYAGGTAYVKNDVVYYATNGNSYIAKGATTGNVPTSTAHWDLFLAGSSGIWNGGLSLGSAGEVVKVNSSANALEFGTISTGALTLAQYADASANLAQGTTSSNQVSVRLGTNEIAVTPSATTDIIELKFYMSVEGTAQTAYMGFGVQKSTTSGNYSTATSSSNYMFMTGEHSISMGNPSYDNRYRYVGATMTKSAADFGLAAGTTYYLSAHGVTHSNGGAQFKFGYGSSNHHNANHFSMIRYTV